MHTLEQILTMVRDQKTLLEHDRKDQPPSVGERLTAYEAIETLAHEVMRLQKEVEQLKTGGRLLTMEQMFNHVQGALPPR